MALIPRCDFCGKFEPTVKFSDGPLRLQALNFENKLYNFFMTIETEDVEDTKTLEKFQDPKFVMERFLEGMQNGGDIDHPEEFMEPSRNSFKNPFPKLCNNCKREMFKLILSYGSMTGNPKI